MGTFHDMSGRSWNVVLDAPAVLLIRAEVTGFLLNDGRRATNTCARLARDPGMLFCVLYIACKAQCEARGISRDGFFGILRHTLDRATDALIQAMGQFSDPTTRSAIQHELATRQTAGQD